MPPYSNAIRQLVNMLRIRSYENLLVGLHGSGNGPGTCTSVGQEACAVGLMEALRPEDKILTNHRSAGHLLARGADPTRMLAEVLGRQDGYCKGNGGSLHMSASELGVILTSTIVGGELSLAPGVALSQRMLRRPGIVACIFGDGAACEGIFHESLNLAAAWRLPVLYVCENNEWQAYVRRDETMLVDSISARARAYGMASESVDGNDVEAVSAAAQAAAAQVRAGGTPFLLELRTYRMRGHFEPDDQLYVDAEERQRWAARDPIAALAAKLQQAGLLTSAAHDALQQAVDQSMASALEQALHSPYPDPRTLCANVLA
jgi:TPP-dependent pyruvate/acetoin dehydrogenase alpha subunit